MKFRRPWISGLLTFLAVGIGLCALHVDAAVLLFYLLAVAILVTFKAHGSIQNISLAATTVLAALCIIETASTLFEPRLVSTTLNLDKSGGNFEGLKQIVGWGPTAPGRYRVRHVLNNKLIYDVVYTIDSNLLRKVDAGSKGEGIAFLGDSYMFGVGLDDDATLPQQFADLEGRTRPVYNLGVGGWSPAQALAEMRAGIYDKELLNSRLVVEFVAPWQAERVSCKDPYVAHAPRYTLVGGYVVQDGTCARKPVSWLAFFSIYRLFQSIMPVVSDSDIVIFTAVTKEVVHLARTKYKKPIVIYYLRDPAYLRGLRDWDDDKIVQSLRAAGAKVIDYEFPRGPKYRIAGDGHPTRFENASCAQKLFDFLRNEFPNIETTAAH